MELILLAAILVPWLIFAGLVSQRVATKTSPEWRRLAAVAVFIGMALLPVADELVGRFQFQALCNNTLQFDGEAARGKRIREVSVRVPPDVPHQVLETVRGQLRLVDAGLHVGQHRHDRHARCADL